MNKSVIVKKMHVQTGLELHECKVAFESAFEIIKESLINHEPVTIRGFGTLNASKRKAKVARNISKGTSLNVPACVKATFKPSRDLHSKMNP